MRLRQKLIDWAGELAACARQPKLRESPRLVEDGPVRLTVTGVVVDYPKPPSARDESEWRFINAALAKFENTPAVRALAEKAYRQNLAVDNDAQREAARKRRQLTEQAQRLLDSIPGFSRWSLLFKQDGITWMPDANTVAWDLAAGKAESEIISDVSRKLEAVRGHWISQIKTWDGVAQALWADGADRLGAVKSEREYRSSEDSGEWYCLHGGETVESLFWHWKPAIREKVVELPWNGPEQALEALREFAASLPPESE